MIDLTSLHVTTAELYLADLEKVLSNYLTNIPKAHIFSRREIVLPLLNATVDPAKLRQFFKAIIVPRPGSPPF